MQKIHLDTDLGGDMDDLCALAMLLRWKDVEITGITTVAEAQGRRAGYIRHVLELEGRSDIPVAAGADVSNGYYRYSELGYPDEIRYWSRPITPAPNNLEAALELLKQSIEQDATIIAIGPYTNLFLLDQKYRDILSGVKLFLMGGFVYPIRPVFPNWGNEMDWNIQVDVRSAKQVLEHSNPTLIPLTVTVETALRREFLNDLRQAGKVGELIAQQAEEFAIDEQNEEHIGKICEALPNDIINFLHDPLACAIALGWEDGIEIKELPLTIEEKDGWLHEKIDPPGKSFKVVTKIDGPRFNTLWFDTITNKYKEYPMITYREYQDADWKSICQIHDRARPDELRGSCDPRGFIPIEQDKEVEELKACWKYVACEAEQVVGFVGVDNKYLAWLYIDPEFYGKGIGRELLRIGLRQIGAGAWTIVLDGNHSAFKLYESEGFREVRRFAGDNAGYPVTCVRMERIESVS